MVMGGYGWLWVVMGDCGCCVMWVIVHHFLGDCGWLWVVVGDCGILGDCGWLWVDMGDCASFPG